MQSSHATDGWMILFGVISVSWMLWGTFARGRSILKDWARANGLELLDHHSKLFNHGPFWEKTYKGQRLVYRITVRDEHGNVRSGWTRVTNMWGRLRDRKVDVRWD